LTPGGEFVSLELESSRQDGHGKVQELKVINKASRWYPTSLAEFLLPKGTNRLRIHSLIEYLTILFQRKK
jgi:hypothetical protein